MLVISLYDSTYRPSRSTVSSTAIDAYRDGFLPAFILLLRLGSLTFSVTSTVVLGDNCGGRTGGEEGGGEAVAVVSDNTVSSIGSRVKVGVTGSID